MQQKPSTSIVGSGSGLTEGLRGLTCGILFGITSPLVGHPLDCIKTKMQAQAGYGTGGAWRTLVTVVRTEGFLALYRGLLPPLLGSSVYRSVQFSVYGATMGAQRDEEWATREIGALGGMEPRVFVAALVSSTARTVIETPLELLKVRRQTGQGWLPPSEPGAGVAKSLRTLYTGLGVSWVRTVLSLGGFFVLVDHAERHHRELVNAPGVGPFIKGGVCATLAWWLAWPAETLKNRTQSGFSAAAAAATPSPLSLVARVRGVYRGIGPGTMRSVVANGAAVTVFTLCQERMRRTG